AHLVTRPRRKAARPAVVLLSATCRAAPRPPLRELLLLELLLLELVARAVPAVESERLEDQPILLGHVIATLALGGAGPLRTRRVRKRNLARDDRAEARPHVGERAHVARLLLRPHH